ncbi:MAG: MBL fold metallo-hydrolase [Dehalococcoidia bacterium]|nr:MBL fold metallo-hydrolase [Dehalococcoidia bacterium]
MKIRFLGSHNIETSTSGLACLLLDEQIALDAGNLTKHLGIQQQLKLKGVLLTHQHYDHIRDIPSLAMTCFLNNGTAHIYGSQAVRTSLEQHLLNNELFSRFLDSPALHFTIVQPNATFCIGDYLATPIAVNHAVPAQGYYVKKLNRSFFYTGDTGPCPKEFWQQIQPDMLIIEVTSPNSFSDFARAKGHLTPVLLQEELQLFKTLHGFLPQVITVHMNSAQESEIAAELESVANTLSCKITLASEGQEVGV